MQILAIEDYTVIILTPTPSALSVGSYAAVMLIVCTCFFDYFWSFFNYGQSTVSYADYDCLIENLRNFRHELRYLSAYNVDAAFEALRQLESSVSQFQATNAERAAASRAFRDYNINHPDILLLDLRASMNNYGILLDECLLSIKNK